LIEPRLRGIARLGQPAGAVVGLLRQDETRLRPLQRGLAGRDDFGAGADVDVGELRIGDDLGRQRLLVLGDRLGVVDAHQHCAGSDVLAAHDGNLGHAAIDASCDVKPGCVHLALHEQRLAAHQVPDRQTGNGGHHDADDDGRNETVSGCPLLGHLLRYLLQCFLQRFRRDLRLGVSRWHFHHTLR